MLHVRLHAGVAELAADQALGVVHRVARVQRRLPGRGCEVLGEIQLACSIWTLVFTSADSYVHRQHCKNITAAVLCRSCKRASECPLARAHQAMSKHWAACSFRSGMSTAEQEARCVHECMLPCNLRADAWHAWHVSALG